ncbi:YceK/YidQ family lipoprotein [Pseudomonas sp. Marseille-QA0892]
MKIRIVWVAALALSGCGSVDTLTNERSAANDLARWDSRCGAIPRVYSGVFYQFCNLNSPPRHQHDPKTSPESILFDMGLSAIVDTVVIPYTAYQQIRQGSIEVRRSGAISFDASAIE